MMCSFIRIFYGLKIAMERNSNQRKFQTQHRPTPSNRMLYRVLLPANFISESLFFIDKYFFVNFFFFF